MKTKCFEEIWLALLCVKSPSISDFESENWVFQWIFEISEPERAEPGPHDDIMGVKDKLGVFLRKMKKFKHKMFLKKTFWIMSIDYLNIGFYIWQIWDGNSCFSSVLLSFLDWGWFGWWNSSEGKKGDLLDSLLCECCVALRWLSLLCKTSFLLLYHLHLFDVDCADLSLSMICV